MGLAICRRIARQHSGEIVAESTTGCGATFIVKLPLDSCSDAEVTLHHAVEELEFPAE